MTVYRFEGLGEEDVRRLIREETTGRGQAPQQGGSIADPTPVGLAAFALTTFLFAIINAGWLDQIGTFIPLAFFYGGLVQLLAGMWAFRTNNTFTAVMFTSYGAFWGAFGFFFFFADNLGVLTNAGATVGFTLLGWTIFTLTLWIASTRINKALFVLFTLFLLTLLLLALGFLLAIQGLVVAGGYAGIILALCAWYIAAAGVINPTFERTVLPLGEPFGKQHPHAAPTPPPQSTSEQAPPSEPREHQTQTAPSAQAQTLESPEPFTSEHSVARSNTPVSTTPEERITEEPPGEQPTTERQEATEEIVAKDTEQTEGHTLVDSRSPGRKQPGPLADPEVSGDTETLPIADYDSLNMSQITKRLSGLSIEELEQLRDYEAKNKNRRSLLVRFEKRIKLIRQSGKDKENSGRKKSES